MFFYAINKRNNFKSSIFNIASISNKIFMEEYKYIFKADQVFFV